MAETFLTPVIESLIQLLAIEVRSVAAVHKEVESLKRELEIIQSLLKDVNTRSDRGDLGDAVNTWVKQLREEANHIEDVIDEYRWHVAQSTSDKLGFVGSLCKIGCQIKALQSRYPISSQIRNINESLRRIKDIGQGYGLSQSFRLQGSSSKTSNTEELDTRLGSHFIVEEDEYVDVPLVQGELKSFLIEGASIRTVISLVGQGGIGKTTLVKKVYDEVKQNFDCHVWITVSQSYDNEKLLRITMKQIGQIAESTASNYDMIQGLITPLRQYLQTKKYVIVFDDVWDTNFWEVMRYALPSNDKGSRIIITTRNDTVAATCKESPCDFIQELKTWSPNMAWELFCKKAFRHEFERCCPNELEELSQKIVSKCQGLPLAIGAIAGLLSRKSKVQCEWQRVLDNLNFEFKTNPQLTRITKILSLSYHDLPYHLKSCLLYFSIFPEKNLIVYETLCKLWIAEGFVNAREDKTLEEEAGAYLNELIKRNLVSLEICDGLYRVCKVHDLMHEFISSKANDLCFCQVLDKNKSEFQGKHRRLSIHDSMLRTVTKSIQPYNGVRSIFLFKFSDELIKMSSLTTLFQKFKLLKVLNFQNAPIDYLPEEVGTLFHLRYLNLLGTKIEVLPKSIGKLCNLQVLNLRYTLVHRLPKSIGKLHNLQTLNLMDTFVRELPVEINKLQNLRHISATCKERTTVLPYSGGSLGVKIQEGFGYLENLETLENVEVHLGGVTFMKELDKLSKLKSLGVTNLTKETSGTICVAVKKLNHLESLYLRTDNGDEILDIKPIASSPPPLMRILCLVGRLNEFPPWISYLSNLQGLMLCFSKLIDDPLKYLKDLPNLLALRLISSSFDGEQLHFEEGGFLRLNDLKLVTLKGLKLVKIDTGALPLLKTLDIHSCPLLEEVPSGIQYLRNLKQLSISDMPREFVLRMQMNGGPDYLKIQHVPAVHIK
ncbi:NB-ARC domain, LRR domain containing protein [Parasponia andersonii]|uniref:NB-ARC domain, LRR domain containing protein n=1 Tax=Parasponia andersonii TaxID=3476 RepID=A0A2P5D1B5_PARAD|nr:NB-ARC domain, LRR domain containing protein [Parasponia andersonii]